MKKALRNLELLSPAANAEIAIQAILHGADAVYIGPPSHGARKMAANSIDDIERVVDFAHQYRAKVYATVNTIIYDSEIKQVENLCRELYHAGIDALIIQDMGILRMKIPPIALHASTQCDIRTPEKAKFLEEVGFSQLVLARELTLQEIKDITTTVSIPVETFIHGALCVSYSGRCHASYVITGRSSNRGECAQICRFPYTLTDSDGKIISKDRYLLSLKDFNASRNLKDLINAGVSSFKIEGRLKDAGYVKNITALYNLQLNEIVKGNPELYGRSSFGEVKINFNPQADKSFNRGFTNYFIEKRKPSDITSFLTPKSLGEKISSPKILNNGDGISFFDNSGEFTGVKVNKIEHGRIIPARNIKIPDKAVLYRTSDIKWDKIMQGETATRKISLEITLDNKGISAHDERGVKVRKLLDLSYENAKKIMEYKPLFDKLGNTPYSLKGFYSKINEERFYRASELTKLRRELIDLIDVANKATYPYEYRRVENKDFIYPSKDIDFRDNVSNRLAKEFYSSHGVTKLEEAIEVTGAKTKGKTLMTTRHCVLRELGICKQEKGNTKGFRFPLYLNYDGGRFKLEFDCSRCEMKLLLD